MRVKIKRLEIYCSNCSIRFYWYDSDMIGYRYWIAYPWKIKYMGHLPF